MLFSLLRHIVNKFKSFPKAGIKGKVSLALNTYAPSPKMKFFNDINILILFSIKDNCGLGFSVNRERNR